MPGSFFPKITSYLPKSKPTLIMLGVGVLGILGIISSLFLMSVGASSQATELKIDDTLLVPKVSPHLEEKTPKKQPSAAENNDDSHLLDTRTSINTASQKQLEELPSIGPKKAQKIQHGRPYKSIDEFIQKNAFSSSQTKQLVGKVKL